ncbi:indoleamine 2,3-dioxygenase 2-like [Conger conger]|uniref:indoleamine 2,3-dioxygenase 2-like n=1 Tax=Conger conger TaxID=82655 RepID=UPI002A5A8FD1|nr:indoleamine 2,3-dioxygenase 2-like [Conger conger]
MEADPSAPVDLSSFCVSEKYGFLLTDPLTDLPEYYWIWMDLARNVPHLVQTHQLQARVAEMPLLSSSYLKGHRELRLARTALGFITMGYVWQDGAHQPAKVLPKVLAVPYCTVSKMLGLPPILVYADCVLANWWLRDPGRPMEIENIDTLFMIPGGDSCKGFFLVSVLVEQSACTGLQGLATVMNSMLTRDITAVQEGLTVVSDSIRRMAEVFKLIHKHVEPTMFYNSMRTFFMGWKDNPALPNSLWYEGVPEQPPGLNGLSAGQSSALQCFDLLLGVQYSDETGRSFQESMRAYMPPPHRQLLETVSSWPPLRHFVLWSSSQELRHSYNSCVLALADLRTYHLNVTARYITIPAGQAKLIHCPFGNSHARQETHGSGGSNFLPFLKGIRDDTKRALITDQ